MRIKALSVRNFRNIRDWSFEPSSGIQCFVGQNGTGKTSILEAISWLGSLSSFRKAKPEDLISRGESWTSVKAEITSLDGVDSLIEVQLIQEPSGRVKKNNLIDGKTQTSAKKYLDRRFGEPPVGFTTVTFNPGDHELVRGDPGGRRAYLDRLISSLHRSGSDLIWDFHRILHSRNTLLKALALNQSSNGGRELLEVYTDQFIQKGAHLLLMRQKYCAELQDQVLFWASKVARDSEPIRLRYLPSGSGELIENKGIFAENYDQIFAGLPKNLQLEDFVDLLRKKHRIVAPKEPKTGFSLFGPQRDDWALGFSRGGLKEMGSQGEVRTALLALRLGEVSLLRMERNQEPIFLLDDFSSELDLDRRNSLLDILKESQMQVFVTSTERPIGFSGDQFQTIKMSQSVDGAESAKGYNSKIWVEGVQ